MGFLSRKTAKAIDKTARSLPDNRFGDAVRNGVLAPVRGLCDEDCTCGEPDCPARSAEPSDKWRYT